MAVRSGSVRLGRGSVRRGSVGLQLRPVVLAHVPLLQGIDHGVGEGEPCDSGRLGTPPGSAGKGYQTRRAGGGMRW